MSVQAPETFLELCQRTASECSTSLTGPSGVSGQTGRLGQIVNWVQAAWFDIQTRFDDWLFMRFGFTLDTTSGDGEYAYSDATDAGTGVAIAAFRRWCGDRAECGERPMRIYLVSAGVATESELRFLDYPRFAQLYLIGSPTNSYPRHWTRAPNGNLLLGPKPDGIYRVSGEFIRGATALSGDSGEPELPKEYRMAIVYRAMMKYGRYNAAAEVYNDGQQNYNRMIREAARTQRPVRMVPGPLA